MSLDKPPKRPIRPKTPKRKGELKTLNIPYTYNGSYNLSRLLARAKKEWPDIDAKAITLVAHYSTASLHTMVYTESEEAFHARENRFNIALSVYKRALKEYNDWYKIHGKTIQQQKELKALVSQENYLLRQMTTIENKKKKILGTRGNEGQQPNY